MTIYPGIKISSRVCVSTLIFSFCCIIQTHVSYTKEKTNRVGLPTYELTHTKKIDKLSGNTFFPPHFCFAAKNLIFVQGYLLNNKYLGRYDLLWIYFLLTIMYFIFSLICSGKNLIKVPLDGSINFSHSAVFLFSAHEEFYCLL